MPERLFRHFGQDAGLGNRFETASIDYQIRLRANPAVTVMAITGQTRQIMHQRIPRLGQTIEQRGFADIGSADQNKGGFHKFRLRVGAWLQMRKPRRPYWSR